MKAWVDQLFSASTVDNGGVVRRSMADVKSNNALTEIIETAREAGFHVIATGDQLLVICNKGHIKIYC
jgi:hypothetical protein